MAISKERFLKDIKHSTYVYINKKELKEYLNVINERFDFNYDFYKNHAFIKSSDKIWIASPNVLAHNYSGLRIEGIGMVFARIIKDGIKITTNAVQLFGRYAKKNVFEISEEEKNLFIRGLDLMKELPTDEGYVILKYNDDYLGVGKYLPKQKLIKNMIPKARRIKKM